MTFSIVARVGEALGVAVASKFIAVGAVVPEVRIGVGAVATQSYARYAYRDELLADLAAGLTCEAAIHERTAADPEAPTRQLGLVGMPAAGAATFTGSACMPWAGGVASSDDDVAYAIQGNILTGANVVAAMEQAFLETAGQSLSRRLVASLVAGDAAGGDSRGRQGAALLVKAPGVGYDECGIESDLRVDDHPDATRELALMLQEWELVNGPPEDVQPLDGSLRDEVAGLLRARGHDGPDVATNLADWAGGANLEARISPDGIDAKVLDVLRSTAAPRIITAPHNLGACCDGHLDVGSASHRPQPPVP